MNKLTKVLSVFIIAGVIGTGAAGIAGCKKDNGHTHSYSYTDNADGTHNGTCDCGKEPITNEAHVDADGNKVCDKCDAAITSGEQHTHKYTYTDNGDGTHKGECACGEGTIASAPHRYGTDAECDDCGYTKTDVTMLDDDDRVDPIEVEKYEDVNGEPSQVAPPIIVEKTSDGAALEEGKVDAVYEFDPATLSTTKYESGWTNGTFSIGKGTEVRGRVKSVLYEGDTIVDASYVTVNSVKLGGSNDYISINVPAAGTLVFNIQNGSSGTTGTQTVILTKPDGTTQDINYPANGSGSTIQRITLQLDAQGEYKISRKAGTSDIYYAKFTTQVNNSAVESISIANTGKTEFLVGQELDCTSIAVVRRHTNGVTIPVPANNVTVDASAYNPNVAGTYEIKVSYTLEGNLDSQNKTFETSYNVEVYDYGDLSVSVNKIKQGSNTAAGNGAYINEAFKQFYFVGDEFSTDGISFGIVGKLGDKTKNFKLDASAAEITGYDMSKAGVQTVKVAYTLNGVTKAKGLHITVKPLPDDIASQTEIVLAVNEKFAQANVGTQNVLGAYRFRTIQQALEFLSAAGIEDNIPKTMYLAEGTYWEKVEVTVPNLTIIGKGAEKTKIEYDALYGVEDAGGFVHTTDSTATFNVRDKAIGFTIKGVTISNYYNNADAYTGAPSNDCRALAMLIQADKVVMEDCTLLGYQDTLELFTGRQLIKNCLIVGVTDYIFGTNNTTYFVGCELRNLNHIKASQPGYVTAFKGNNKGTGVDKVTYGAIFDDCDFTAEEGVPEGLCALGRAWGVDAAVMIMNSRIGAHISKTASTTQGGRYISMGNGDPTGAQFTEYNNTGDGAITESLATVKVLTEAQAANYSNFEVIFGKVNNLVKYSDVWDGSYGSIVTEKVFNFDDIASGQQTSTEEFKDLYEGLSFKGTCNVQAEKSQAQFYAGTDIKVGIKGKVTVTFYGGDYGNDSNGRIVYKDGYATIHIIGNHNNIYITKIVVDKSEIPADTVERTVTVYDGENVLGTIVVNDGSKVALSDVKAMLSGEAYEGKELDKVLTAVGGEEYNFDTAIAADTSLYVVTKDKAVITQKPITTNTTYTFDKGCDAIEDTEYFKFTNCKKNGDWFLFGGEGSSIKFTVAAGAVVIWERSPYDNGTISINGNELETPKGGTVVYSVGEAGEVVITASGASYFKTLNVSFVSVYEVTFNYNDDGVTANKVEKVVSGSTVQKPADPARDNYTFLYWYAGEDDSVAYDFNTPVTGAVELKAKWQAAAEATEYTLGSVIDTTAITNVYKAGTDRTTGLEQGVLLDATSGLIQKNGDNTYLTDGATIKVKVAAGLTVLPVWHNATQKTGFTVSERDADGYITIAANAGATNYIMKILVVNAYDVAGGTFDFSQNNLGAGVTIQKHYASNGIIEIDATASGAKVTTNTTYSQVNAGTVIKFKAPEGVADISAVTATVTAYNDADLTSSYTIAMENGYITLTATAQGYPKSIQISITAA